MNEEAEIGKKVRSSRGKAMINTGRSILSQKLWVQILIGLFLGAVTGLSLSPHGLALIDWEYAFPLGEWLSLPGIIFLGLIQMVIIPLVACSIILGICETASVEFLRRMGLRVLLYFVVTTTIAIIIGLSLVNTIKPGVQIDSGLIQAALDSDAMVGRIPKETFEDLTIPERVANLVPTNLAKASLDKNMLQIVIASILIGIAMLVIPKKHEKPFHELCTSGQMITMEIIGWAMRLAPYAVFGLLTNITIRLGPQAFVSVAVYMAVVICGLICMVSVYMFILALIARVNPVSFLKSIREVQLLAFSTSSSAATMPFSIAAAEEKLNVRPDISRLIIPLGATVNMDGTAMYQVIAALFLCQVFGIDLEMHEMVLLVITTVGASIGTPGTPGVGIVVLATILAGIGVPAEGLALILGVDRILDMCRTTVNVTGDLTATLVMQRWLPQSMLDDAAKKNA